MQPPRSATESTAIPTGQPAQEAQLPVSDARTVPWLRRLFRPKFSLRTLLLGMAIVGVGLGLFQRLDQTRQLVARIEAAGGRCGYATREPIGRFGGWLRERLPRSYFDKVTEVGLYNEAKDVDVLLAQLVRLKSLEALWIENTQVSHAGLAHLVRLKSLKSLHLDNSHVGDAEFIQLAGLKSLKTLGLDHAQVSGAGLMRLAGLKSLKTLDLNNTQVGDADLRHLAELKSLESLGLDNTQVGDAGLAHLAKLESLKELWLNNTQVSDAGVAHLVELKSLKYIWLNSTHVSDAGFQQIHASLPDCLVYGQ